jgi:hypothetical protein
MLTNGISTDEAKYRTSIEKNGFILTILNLTVKDLNISYTCSCEFDLDKHILYIEDITLQNNVKSCPNFGDVSNTVHLTIIIIVKHNIL